MIGINIIFFIYSLFLLFVCGICDIRGDEERGYNRIREYERREKY